MGFNALKTNLTTRLGVGCLAVSLILMDFVHLHGQLNSASHFASGLFLGMSLVFLLRGLYTQRRKAMPR